MKFVSLIAEYLDMPDLHISDPEVAENVSMSIPEPELPVDLDRWPRLLHDAYTERAAIMEFEGGMDRQDAESGAEAEIRDMYRNNPGLLGRSNEE